MSTAARPGSQTTHWRIDTLERADVVFQLRDFFRRLGLRSEVRGPTIVEVEAELPAAAVEAHVRDWAKVTGVTLDLVPLDAGPEMLLPPPEKETPRLGELLIGKGFLTPEQLEWALDRARATGELLGVTLLKAKLIYEDELARTLSDQLAIPYLSIMRVGLDPFVARLLPAPVGKAAAAIPVHTLGDAVQVAFADPTDKRALSTVREHLPRIEIAVGELSDIMLAWRDVGDARDLARAR